jgi:hypothetical protein
LGINVQNDGGGLFTLALIVFFASSVFLILNKEAVFSFISTFKK